MPLTLPPTAHEIAQVEMLGGLSPTQILYEAEAPIVFTISTGLHQSMLAYLADENLDGSWFILAPCSQTTIEQLRLGLLPLRDALCATWIWLAQRGLNNTIRAWSIESADVPSEYLPAIGATLTPLDPTNHI